MNHAIKIGADNTISIISAENDGELTALQNAVGGWIEVVPEPVRTDNGKYALIVNEEGIPMGLEYNELASMISIRPIYGDAALAKIEDGDLQFSSLTETINLMAELNDYFVYEGVTV